MSPVLGVVIVASALGVWWARRRSGAARIDSRRELSAVASHMARAVNDSVAPAEALERAGAATGGAVGDEVASVVSLVHRGASFDDALAAWSELAHAPRSAGRPEDVGLLVAATRFGGVVGGDLVAALEGVSMALLDRAEIADETAALTSQARASVVVICLLPVAGIAMFAIVQPEVAVVLVSTTPGRLALGTAVVLDLAAVAISRHLVQRALR